MEVFPVPVASVSRMRSRFEALALYEVENIVLREAGQQGSGICYDSAANSGKPISSTKPHFPPQPAYWTHAALLAPDFGDFDR
jgi:hypothetical protein